MGIYYKEVEFALGVEPDVLRHPSDKAVILGMIENCPNNIVYMATGHGDPYWADVTETQKITPSDLQAALQDRGPMKFSLVIHSDAMGDINPGTWAPTLTKGQTTGAVVVGTKGTMTDPEWYTWQQGWAQAFFAYVWQGFPFKKAFDLANQMYPNIAGHVAFHGDWFMTRRDLT